MFNYEILVYFTLNKQYTQFRYHARQKRCKRPYLKRYIGILELT